MSSIGPQRLTDYVGKPDVGDTQPLVVTEHQRRGTNVSVNQAMAMDDIEGDESIGALVVTGAPPAITLTESRTVP